jgi:hypothetical protein
MPSGLSGLVVLERDLDAISPEDPIIEISII